MLLDGYSSQYFMLYKKPGRKEEIFFSEFLLSGFFFFLAILSNSGDSLDFKCADLVNE